MSEHPNNDAKTPLEDLLEGLPTEEPPGDLQRRCLQALRQEDALGRRAPSPFWLWAPRFAAAAVVMFVALVGITLMQSGDGRGPISAHEHAAETDAGRPSPPAAESAKSMIPPPPGGLGAAKVGRVEHGAEEAEGWVPAEEGVPGRHLGGPRVIDRLGGDDYAPYGGYVDGHGRRIPDPDDLSHMQDLEIDGVETSVPPWYERPGERKQVVSKSMEVEVEDVEDAYDRAVSIVDKSGGYVLTQDMRISDDESDRAIIDARVPVESVDGVIAQLRELGKTVSLVGQSQDRTRDYYNKGRDIRSLGATEDELVEEYERTWDQRRKRELLRQIEAIRAQNAHQKDDMVDLAVEVEMAELQITLTERAGPAAFMSRLKDNAVSFLSWIAVTAVFWLPALLIVWFVMAARNRARESA